MREPLNARPIPSLAQWLGDGSRAEDFEEWVRESLEHEANLTSAVDKRSIRILRTVLIAFVEAARIEDQIAGDDRPPGDRIAVVTALARCAGIAVMNNLLCLLDPAKSPPLLKVAKMFTAEFGHAARKNAQAATELGAWRRSPDA